MKIEKSALSETVVETREWEWVFVASAILLIFLVVPFLWAFNEAEPAREFVGVLINPIDGASYLSKMYQGMEGSWFFELPYTPEDHPGVLLYVLYVGIGHLTRLLDTQMILVFHTMRLLGTLLMFILIYRFTANWTNNIAQRRLTWALAILGCGFGWVALLVAGYATPDILLLPEAFPFQAAYANVHFPLSIGLMVLMAQILVTVFFVEDDLWPGFDIWSVGLAVGSLMLITTSPFVLAPLAIGSVAVVIWKGWRYQQIPWRDISWGGVVALFVLPMFAYNVWAISEANPILNTWMAQNLTPSKPVWEYLVAFGPLLILAGIGIWHSRKSLKADDLFLLGWLLGTFVLIYMPLGLQRRFAMGITIPLAIYAARAVQRVMIPRIGERWHAAVVAVVFITFLPTLLIAYALPMLGIVQAEETADQYYFIHDEEVATLEWLEANVDQDAVVLASPEMGLFLPMYGRTVIYGHPFETINPDAREAAVEDFYNGMDCSVIEEEDVSYVMLGPRERDIEGDHCPIPGELVYESPSGMVSVFDVP